MTRCLCYRKSGPKELLVVVSLLCGWLTACGKSSVASDARTLLDAELSIDDRGGHNGGLDSTSVETTDAAAGDATRRDLGAGARRAECHPLAHAQSCLLPFPS